MTNSQVHPRQAIADIIWVSLLDIVGREERGEYEGRLLDHASGELVGPELGHSQQCAVSHLAHPFTAAGKHARARNLRHLEP